MQKATRSFLPKSILVITLGLITSLTGYNASAIDVVTDPVGFITLSVQGSNGVANARANSLLGLGMTRIVTNRGVVANATTNAIVDNGATWADNDYTNGLAFIEITSGPNAGLMDDIVGASGATKTVYTANNLVALVGAAAISNQTYKIYPHWTLATVFGPTDDAGLKQGSATTADQIKVFNPITQAFTTYYYSSGGGAGIGWRSTGTTDQSNVKLYLDQGVLIARNVGTNLTFKLVGGVKLGQTIEDIGGTNNFAGNVYATSAMTLTNSNLLNGTPATSLTGGSATTADQVKILNTATGAYTAYYWSAGGGAGTGWRSTGTVDQGGVSIPIGTSVLVVRKPPRTPISWFAPAPY